MDKEKEREKATIHNKCSLDHILNLSLQVLKVIAFTSTFLAYGYCYMDIIWFDIPVMCEYIPFAFPMHAWSAGVALSSGSCYFFRHLEVFH